MKNLCNHATLSFVLSVGALALTGCGLANSVAVPVQGVAIRGNVHGGQQPIAHALIQLYEAGTNGYGIPVSYANGMSLLQTPVYTDAHGMFNITADYTCPSASTQVYIVATGGNPGLSGNVSNSAIALMAALGPCGQLTAQTSISMNELTTVASVWALAPFMTSVTGVGTSGPSVNRSGNFTGLENAFVTVNKLVNIASGTASGPALPAGASAPVANLDVLADILAACINTSGPTGSGTPCDSLFGLTTVNGHQPTDTITAALVMAQHPNGNVSSLTSLVNAQAPFQPTNSLTDFSLVIRYTGGALSHPSGIAIDASGNIWVPNAGNNSVTKLDAQGVTASDKTGFLSGSSGYTAGQLNAPSALAIDLNGNAWVANHGNSTVTELNAIGSTGTVFAGGGLATPNSIAVDASGAIWVANQSSATVINTSGALTTYTNTGIASPTAIAINPK